MTAELTSLIQRADQADPAAADELFALLYEELRRLAESHLRRGHAGLTLGTTTLVHEAWLSMAGRRETAFPDRARFFAYVSRAMRGLVIDYARRRQAVKRGRNLEITLDEASASDPETEAAAVDLPALGDALGGLARVDADLAELVDMHYFAGFALGEIAALREVSERTVQRDWRKARVLLHQALRVSKPSDSSNV